MATDQKKVHPIIWVMLFIIGIISMIDLALAIYLLDPTSDYAFSMQEKNPMVVWIVRLTGDFSIFVPMKILGTIISLLSAKQLYVADRKRGSIVCSGVCPFQILLLAYLLFGPAF